MVIKLIDGSALLSNLSEGLNTGHLSDQSNYKCDKILKPMGGMGKLLRVYKEFPSPIVSMQ